jgi:hypothetical protein
VGGQTSIVKGFSDLAALDPNNSGEITSKDPIFSELEVWADSNSNGIVDPGELHSLASLGIQSISLSGSPVSEDVAGNTITAIGSVTFTDGTTEAIDDVTFASADSDVGNAALPPTVSTANIALNQSESVTASSLFTTHDPSGLAIKEYQFEDSTTANDGGHFVMDAAKLPAGQIIDVTAAQLGELGYQAGFGSDTVAVRASNGAAWSSWSVFSISNPQGTSPVASTVPNNLQWATPLLGPSGSGSASQLASGNGTDASLALLNQYAANSFAASSSGIGGSPISEAAQDLSTHSSFISQPHS